jgi:hypothetical protein
MHDKLILTVAASIQSYLAAQPDSAATLTGIHEWWVKWPADTDPEEAVEAVTLAALEQLAEAGIVERIASRRRDIWRAKRGVLPVPE